MASDCITTHVQTAPFSQAPLLILVFINKKEPDYKATLYTVTLFSSGQGDAITRKTLELNSYNTLVAGAEGIEPSSTVLETAVLPLYYAPIAGKPLIYYKPLAI